MLNWYGSEGGLAWSMLMWSVPIWSVLIWSILMWSLLILSILFEQRFRGFRNSLGDRTVLGEDWVKIHAEILRATL